MAIRETMAIPASATAGRGRPRQYRRQRFQSAPVRTSAIVGGSGCSRFECRRRAQVRRGRRRRSHRLRGCRRRFSGAGSSSGSRRRFGDLRFGSAAMSHQGHLGIAVWRARPDQDRTRRRVEPGGIVARRELLARRRRRGKPAVMASPSAAAAAPRRCRGRARPSDRSSPVSGAAGSRRAMDPAWSGIRRRASASTVTPLPACSATGEAAGGDAMAGPGEGWPRSTVGTGSVPRRGGRSGAGGNAIGRLMSSSRSHYGSRIDSSIPRSTPLIMYMNSDRSPSMDVAGSTSYPASPGSWTERCANSYRSASPSLCNKGRSAANCWWP